MFALIALVILAALVWAVVTMSPVDRRANFDKARDLIGGWMKAHRDDRRAAPPADLSEPSQWTDDEKLPTERVDERPQVAVGITGSGKKQSTVYAPPDTPILCIGASGSGKTTAVIGPSLLEWRGPAISTSVKHDVLALTVGHRQRLGPIAVFDPAGTLPDELVHLAVPWTPLASCLTWEGAFRTAGALVAASSGGDSGSGDSKYWEDQALLLLAPILFYEATTDSTMAGVNRWLARLMAPPAGGGDDEDLGYSVADLIAALDQLAGADVAGAENAAEALRPLEGYAPQTAGSIVATANRALRAYKLGGDGEKLRPSDPNIIRPEMLLDVDGTVYLCAPPADQRIYKPLFTALLSHLIDAGYSRAARRIEGRLERPLLVAADELANVAPIPEMQTIVSTARSFGITVLAAIQDVSQLRATYGTDGSNTVLSNQATVLVLPGTKDLATLEWASTIAGEKLVKERTKSVAVSASHNRGELTAAGTSESSTTNENQVLRPLASKARISSMEPGVLLAIVGHHRSVLRQRRHYEVDELRDRAAVPIRPTPPKRPPAGGLAARRPS